MHRRSGTKHRPRIARAYTLLEVMIVVLTIGILLTVAIPNFLTVRKRSQKVACIANLKRIDEAKELAAAELGRSEGENIDESSLLDYLSTSKIVSVNAQALGPIGPSGPMVSSSSLPNCPGGGTYELNPVGTAPTCSLGASEGHVLP